MSTNLDLLDLLVIRWRHTVQVRRDLRAQIRRSDERAQDVLRQNIGVRGSIILDVVVGHVDVLQTQGKVRRRDRAHAPVGLAAEHRLLVVRGWARC